MPRKRRYRHRTWLEVVRNNLSPKKVVWASFFFIFAVLSFAHFVKAPTVIDAEAAQIVETHHIQDPLFSFGIDDGGETYIVSAIKADHGETRLLSLQKSGASWQERSSLLLNCSLDACPEESRVVKLGGQEYVYFVTESYGSAMGTVVFNLFSPSESHLYTISGYGTNGNINQPEPIPKDVAGNKAVYDYLAGQIEKSTKLARLTDRDIDAFAPENAAKKWQVDNAFVDTAMVNSSAPVKFTYYDTSLFDTSKKPKITDSIENSHYKFVAYYKGSVVGQDKHTGKYFILWVPGDMHEWPIALRFVDPNTIRIGSANRGPTLTVYLLTNQITSP